MRGIITALILLFLLLGVLKLFAWLFFGGGIASIMSGPSPYKEDNDAIPAKFTISKLIRSSLDWKIKINIIFGYIITIGAFIFGCVLFIYVGGKVASVSGAGLGILSMIVFAIAAVWQIFRIAPDLFYGEFSLSDISIPAVLIMGGLLLAAVIIPENESLRSFIPMG